MKLLMLGGTSFVGSAVVAEAVRRGWSVTTLNRGRTEPSAARDRTSDRIDRRYGDRRTPDGHAAIADGTWDLVVDTWSSDPRAVSSAAGMLAGRVGHYAYVSSRSVYREPVSLSADESAAIVDVPADIDDARAAELTYAEMKAGGEKAVLDAFGDRSLMARAGLILGPGENVGRLPWWLRRIERGGDVLAPGPRDLALQYIDARDLASWLLDNGAEGTSGAYNMVSRSGHASMGAVLDACLDATGSSARLHWIDPEPILAAGVEPWNDLPIWIPGGHEYRWLHECDVSRAYATGLSPRPIAATVADTWTRLREDGEVSAMPGRPSLGLDPGVEASILAAARIPSIQQT